MSKTEKAKRPRSAKQLANDERLRQRAKERKLARTEEEDFEPTEVQEAKAAQKAKEERLVAPAVPENAEVTDVRPEDNQPTPVPQPQAVDPNLVATIVAAVMEAQKQFPQAAQAPVEEKFDELEASAPNRTHKARLGAGGEVQGIVYKYEVDKNYYPDPTHRLLDEPKLARFAMRENFIFRWEVDGVEYKKNNITYAEPRFTLELFRKLYSEDGEPTGKAALIARNIMHEDEFTTQVMAGRLGILDQFDSTDEGFRALMSEIRYQRFRQWLLSIFSPAKIETHRRKPRPMVIDGKVVEVFDTENLIDAGAATDKVSALSSQSGVGNVTVPSSAV